MEEKPATYTFIDHTADFGIRVVGADPGALFENAAGALFDLLVDPGEVADGTRMDLEVSGEDYADLMFNWLRELLYLWTGKALLGKRVAIGAITENGLFARVWADPHDPERHRLVNEIKAVTYHQLLVEERPEGWVAQIIFDV